MKMKKMFAVFTAVVMGMIVCGCSDKKTSDSAEKNTVENNSYSNTESAETISKTNSKYFDNEDLDVSSEKSVKINLDGDTAESDSSGVDINGSRVTITEGGQYEISGYLTDGQLYVDTEDFVHIILNDAEITSESSSAIFIANSDKTVITAAENTVNTLTDSKKYKYDSEGQNEPDAVIFSKDDLSVNGKGTLNINGRYNEGITSKDDLRIADLKLNVTAVGIGIKGKDSVAILNSDIDITAGEDGIKTSNTEDSDKGYIVLESGLYNINAAENALTSSNNVIVNDGKFNLISAKGAAGEYSSDEEPEDSFGGRMNFMEGNKNKSEVSAKGIKAESKVEINGGNINADCGDDTIHSNGNIEINGGTINLSSADDGIHADEIVDINGGDITVSESYEGIEAEAINVTGGKIHIQSEDDGFNVSDGSSDGSDAGFMDISENCRLDISGGYVYVNSGGDGLDSNGSINVSGGTVLVDGPVNDANGSLDSGTEINVTGGVIIASGSSGMLELPSDSSSQYSIAAVFSETQQGGVPISVADNNGNVIFTYVPSKNYSSVVMSSPDIKKGQIYTVYYGGNCTEDSENGYYENGKLPSDAEVLDTVEISELITSVGDGNIGQARMGNGNFRGKDDEMPPDMVEMPRNDDFNGQRPDMDKSEFTPPDVEGKMPFDDFTEK